MSYGDVDHVAKLVPFALNMTLARAMEESPELKTSIYQTKSFANWSILPGKWKVSSGIPAPMLPVS